MRGQIIVRLYHPFGPCKVTMTEAQLHGTSTRKAINSPTGMSWKVENQTVPPSPLGIASFIVQIRTTLKHSDDINSCHLHAEISCA
jgi:hypothetical protein